MARQFVNTQSLTGSVLATNSVIRNTYILLAVSLLFSAAMAAVSVVSHAPPIGLFGFIAYFGLLFLVNATANSGWGIVSVFALTGFLGYTLGPILNLYMGLPNGGQVVMTALGGTGLIFFGLSAYALTTRKDFSYMTGFIIAASMVLFLAVIANIFLQLAGLQLLICSGFLLLSSGFILHETSQMIHGGQRNYILATVSLYVSLYNIFLSLLQLLSAFSRKD
jgi:modulator of FtsH protease